MITEIKKDAKFETMVPCSECNRVFKIVVSEDVVDSVERFPFPIVLMHYSSKNDKKAVHTMIAYIDKDMQCRHCTVLDGKRVYITPYILYNPNLVALSCNKSLGGYK
ncbi:MAG: hypothetical protein GF317_07265 [Candidatus Lokiarchaeota archaeon]|nr:hypothetical protein [Candidatus Lokiarchaeota archaeon]MBD3199507.1 hypothetical protein [Candidatus Lokiarchaeota archaeon]